MKRTINACLPVHQMTGTTDLFLALVIWLYPPPSFWYLAFTSNSHLITLIPSDSLFKTGLYSHLARAHASYCGITCPQWHNVLLEGPGEGQGPSLFRPFPVKHFVCLRCAFDTHSLLKNWNKQNHENYWKKWVILVSLFSNSGTLTCICPTFSWDMLKGIKMTALGKSVHP